MVRLQPISSAIPGALRWSICSTPISLLNAVANIGGAFAVLSLQNAAFLFFLNFGTGVLFLLFYYLSRFRNGFEYLYWPFVLLILGFLFVNALGNAGSRGGAHYYFIPALVIAIVLSGTARQSERY